MINIAIAEDQILLREGLTMLLSLYPGINISFHAKDGADMLQKIGNATVKPDVCLLDINMPNMDGYECAKNIQAAYPAIKTIALSMHGSEYNILRMLRNGAKGYLVKDAHPDKIVEAIHKVLKNDIYIAEELVEVMSEYNKNKRNLLRYDFSAREIEFIKLCCTELTYKEMAVKLKLSLSSIDNYREQLFKKLDTHSRIGLVIFAMKTGLVVL